MKETKIYDNDGILQFIGNYELPRPDRIQCLENGNPIMFNMENVIIPLSFSDLSEKLSKKRIKQISGYIQEDNEPGIMKFLLDIKSRYPNTKIILIKKDYEGKNSGIVYVVQKIGRITDINKYDFLGYFYTYYHSEARFGVERRSLIFNVPLNTDKEIYDHHLKKIRKCLEEEHCRDKILKNALKAFEKINFTYGLQMIEGALDTLEDI